MRLKLVADIAAILLFGAYFLPVVVKLRDIPLTVVAVGGIILAAIDSWHSFSDRAD